MAGGMPQTTVSAIECGRANPTPAELERLAQAFQMSVDELQQAEVVPIYGTDLKTPELTR